MFFLNAFPQGANFMSLPSNSHGNSSSHLSTIPTILPLSEIRKKENRALIMGVLNLTPDSFYDGGKFTSSLETSLHQADKMISEGADIIDIGGESSRPFSEPISIEEELRRVLPTIEALAKKNILLSIDTYKPQIALEAAKRGVKLLNDISGLSDPEMRKIALDYNLDTCVMHMQKNPQTMQENPFYPKGVVEEIFLFFEERVNILEKEGFSKEKIFLDPGIGFGKSVEDNFTLIANMKKFQKLGCPLLIGCSRKSFLQKSLQKKAEELLIPTVIVHTFALMQGVDVLRVHDVAEHKEAILLHELMKNVDKKDPF
jgi:dihydropteroate synthase